jgi:MFS family permease
MIRGSAGYGQGRNEAPDSTAIHMGRERHLTPSVLAHGLATFLLATNVVVATLLPLISLRTFNAHNFQLLAVTAAVPTLFTTSIFWQALLRRVPLRRYILIQWAVGVLPIVGIAMAQEFWQLLGCHIVVCSGFAGWTPVSGILLKRLYADRIRGRAFGVLNAITLTSQIGSYLLLGRWLTLDGEAFRTFLPLVALGQTAGMLLTAWIAGGPTEARRPEGREPFRLRDLLGPIVRMRSILRADRDFLRYESAFMTYGCGFMICDALLPLIVTHQLHLAYDQITRSAFAVFRGCMLLAALPGGWLLDRIGPMRTASLAFAGLTFYPLILVMTASTWHLGAASTLYGFMMAGVNLAWMLGPVALAGSQERVSEYVAIHTTLVGVRGILFQSVGIALYSATGSFAWPLILAASMFVIASIQMRSLYLSRAAAAGTPTAMVSAPIESPRIEAATTARTAVKEPV